ncbi:MAG: hypothetical protein AB8G77_24125, partial [Rhodothermales bacterium]
SRLESTAGIHFTGICILACNSPSNVGVDRRLPPGENKLCLIAKTIRHTDNSRTLPSMGIPGDRLYSSFI